MNITFDQYIANPSGSTMIWTFRDMYRKAYTEKYNKTILREAGKMKYDIFYDKKNNEYYIHLKVPSEIVPKFYYDVVIKFYTTKDIGSNNLKKYYVKFFSNDPRFVYTFAHSFIKNDLFVKECVSKMSRQAVKKPAKEKNPKNEIGYVKSLYFAYLYMNDNNLFNASTYIQYALPFNKNSLIKNIMDSDEKVSLREEAERGIQKKNKLEKDKLKRTEDKERRNTKNNNMINNGMFNKTKTVKNTVKTKQVNFSKSTNKTKKI